jgi:hypothetical protein
LLTDYAIALVVELILLLCRYSLFCDICLLILACWGLLVAPYGSIICFCFQKVKHIFQVFQKKFSTGSCPFVKMKMSFAKIPPFIGFICEMSANVLFKNCPCPVFPTPVNAFYGVLERFCGLLGRR